MSRMPQQLSLNGPWQAKHFEPGKGLRQKPYAKSIATDGWIDATVPGCLQLDVFRGTVEDLYYGKNAESVMWVEEKEWWYRRTFKAPRLTEGQRLWLNFEGVDFESHVWLNGRKIVDHIGTFTPFEIEITKLVTAEDNQLAVQLDRAYHNVPMKSPVGNEYDWSLWLEQLGIWDDVTLVTTGTVRIQHVQLIPRLSAARDAATLEAFIELEAATAGTYELRWNVCEDGDARAVYEDTRQVKLKKGHNRITLEGKITQAKLWWPSGYGDQQLYQADFTIGDASGRQPSDQRREQFGLREISYEHGPGMSAPTPEWIFRVNGRRLFARGINWVPADQLSATMTRERYRHLIRRAVDTRSIIFRMWGGGGRQKRAFYDLCDRYGIMLQQEFPLANQALPERADVRDLCCTEVRGIVRHVINHPSIVIWGGGNEFNFDPENPILVAMGDVCRAIDPTRRYLNTSPLGQEMHSPWEYSFPGYYEIYNKYRRNMPMMSEFGCPGMVNLESLRKFMPPEEMAFPPERVPPFCEIVLDKARPARFVRMTITRVENACKAYNDIFNCYLPDGTDVTPYHAKRLYDWKVASGYHPAIDAFDVIDETGENHALKRKGARVRASSERSQAEEIKRRWPSVPRVLVGCAENIIDGQYGQNRCWVAQEPHKGWFEIELAQAVNVRRFVWSRDRLGRFFNNIPLDYKIETSLDGKRWETAYEQLTPSRSSYFNLYNNWAYHKGILGYDSYETWLYEDNLLDLFGIPNVAEVYIQANQYLQSEGSRYCIEHMRRLKYHPAGGAYFWQYDEPWPNISCDAVVDYYGEPKQAFYFIARAYEDFHISAQYEKILWRPGEKFRTEVWLHNDTLTEPANCRVDLALRLLNGRTLWASQCSTPLLRDAAFHLTTVEWDVTAEIEDQVFVLDLRVTAADGTLLSSNPYCFGTSMPVLQPMLAAPKARLTTEQKPLKLQLKPGEEITCALPFTNDAKAYALVVHCELELDGGSGLFHTYFQDNDRIAFGGEACRYQLGLRAAENTAPGRYQGHFVLAGWNIAKTKIPVSIELVKEQSL